MQLSHAGFQPTDPPHEAIRIGSVQFFDVSYNHVCHCRKEGIDCQGTCSQGKVTTIRFTISVGKDCM